MRKEVAEHIEKAFYRLLRWLKSPSNDVGMTFNVLLTREDDIFIAHCLELDIVATANTLDQARKDIVSLITAQIDYAFSNDNLKNLFHPAPPQVWATFFSCKERIEERHRLASAFEKETIPPWIITNTCQSANLCHA